MAELNFTQALLYDINTTVFDSSLEDDGTLPDDDNDDLYTPGDNVDGLIYQGTVEIDGTTMPVFDDIANGFTIVVVPADRGEVAPVDIPPALPVVNAQAFVICFLAGTMVATPDGERAVEELAIGDPVLTADGRTVPVHWIGRQTVTPRFSGPRTLPVMIEKGALSGVVEGRDGAPVPHRDLVVTADHGMIVDGLVVNASALVNGSTIRFMASSELAQSVTYYHVETEAHDEILAEGAPAETYVDYVARRAFDNHAEYEALYGVERIVPEMARERVSSARLLPEHLRERLGITDAAPAEELLDAAFEQRAA